LLKAGAAGDDADSGRDESGRPVSAAINVPLIAPVPAAGGAGPIDGSREIGGAAPRPPWPAPAATAVSNNPAAVSAVTRVNGSSVRYGRVRRGRESGRLRS
jgi:hypothetical protein